MIVETLVFDGAQVTSKINRQRSEWGGCCYTLAGGNAAQALLIIREKEDETDNANRETLL